MTQLILSLKYMLIPYNIGIECRIYEFISFLYFYMHLNSTENSI